MTHGSVQFMAACLLPRYLFEKTDCQRGSAVREETPQGKTLEYKYRIPLLPPPPQYLSNQVFAVLFETEVTLPGHKCSKSRERDKPSVHLSTQFNYDLKKSFMMVCHTLATLTESKKAAVVLPPP